MTTRRSFLGSILAAATPPGFVRAGVLMPVVPVIAMSHAEKVAALDGLAAAWDEFTNQQEGVRIHLLSEPHPAKQWVRLASGAWVSESTLILLGKNLGR